MKDRKANDQITITGIVIAADWDEDGKIISVAISTSNPLEDEYFVENDAMGKELLELFGSEVVVTGAPGSDEFGNKTIAVKKYELLQDEDEEEFGDEEPLEDEEEFEYQEEQW